MSHCPVPGIAPESQACGDHSLGDEQQHRFTSSFALQCLLQDLIAEGCPLLCLLLCGVEPESASLQIRCVLAGEDGGLDVQLVARDRHECFRPAVSVSDEWLILDESVGGRHEGSQNSELEQRAHSIGRVACQCICSTPDDCGRARCGGESVQSVAQFVG